MCRNKCNFVIENNYYNDNETVNIYFYSINHVCYKHVGSWETVD